MITQRDKKIRRTRGLFKVIDLLTSMFGARIGVRGAPKFTEVTYDVKKGIKADLYLPENAGKHPVFVNIHGGGFVAGDKAFRRRFCSEIARLGYAVLNVNYTTCDQAPLPGFIEDIVSALGYLLDNADKLGLDTSKVVIGGDSAGGLMAFLTGAILMNPLQFEKLLGKISGFMPVGLAMMCGLYSYELAKRTDMPFNVGDAILSAVVGQGGINALSPEALMMLEPVKLLNKRTPPCFVSFTEADDFCKGQEEILLGKLEELDLEVHCVKEKKAIHCWHLLPGKRSRKARRELHEFLIRLK